MLDHIVGLRKRVLERTSLGCVSTIYGQRKGARTLLTTTQLLDALLVIMLAVERDTDTNTRIVLHTLTLLLIRLVVFTSALISFTLNNQAATTSWYQALEDRGKLLRDLLESPLDSLIFALVKDVDEVLN